LERHRQRHLVLILAREFASNLATATLIADNLGRLVFYNEAAEAVVGRRFAEAGEMQLDEWTAGFVPRTVESVRSCQIRCGVHGSQNVCFEGRVFPGPTAPLADGPPRRRPRTGYRRDTGGRWVARSRGSSQSNIRNSEVTALAGSRSCL
jgi:PAS domain-containing protein